jgi:hypothetical protein
MLDEEIKDRAYSLKSPILEMLAKFKEFKIAPARVLIYSLPIK